MSFIAEPTNKPRWPAEFEPQALLMLAWPDEHTDWAARLAPIQALYLELIQVAQSIVPVWLICRSPAIEHQIRSKLGGSGQVCFSICDYNDTWIRDYGPLVTRRGSHYILNDFQFTGWGDKYDAKQDNHVTLQLYESGAFEQFYKTPLTLESHDFILEGGGVETNGQGVIITTEKCQLNTNRGARTHMDVAEVFKKNLGAEEILWINSGEIIGDDTDAHIDTLIRFIDPSTLVYQGCDKPNDPHYVGLSKMKAELNQLNHRFNLIELPLPSPVFDETDNRLGATYANFIILNQSIIFPTYGCDEDSIAISRIQAQLPNYTIYPLDARELIRQGGSLHCASLQLPI